jgi:hypothetical protein
MCKAFWPGPAALSIFVLIAPALAGDLGRSEWVHADANGKLEYKTTPSGDRILDFSHAGYMGGGVAIPDVPVKRTVKPTGGEDDTSAIQSAIDEVAMLPLENGFRGAVLLAEGTFNCSQTISISASGIVLRGSGDKTTIKLTGKPHLAIAARRADPRNRPTTQDDESTLQTKLIDAYVPSGAVSINVADAKGFAVGDTVQIRRPITEAWIRFMHMDDMTRDGRQQRWIRAGDTTNTERTVAAISGNSITLDVPLSDSFDAKYIDPPSATIAKITPNRLTQMGIERLHIESPPQEISHSQPHFGALRMNGQDCWIRDVTIDETMNSVAVGGRRITLQRISINRKAQHQGASKPAEFAPNGTQVLMDRCSVNADNVWYVATGAGVAGPIVILNCTFTGNGRAESHQRWSTGMLYDNVRVPTGAIELRNRGSMGSGHGWSMGWGVVWNCTAAHYIVQNPPGAINWLIGCIGESQLAPRPFGEAPDLPEGITDSHGHPVAPRSLYLFQLAERLGSQTLTNLGYETPYHLAAP